MCLDDDKHQGCTSVSAQLSLQTARDLFDGGRKRGDSSFISYARVLTTSIQKRHAISPRLFPKATHMISRNLKTVSPDDNAEIFLICH